MHARTATNTWLQRVIPSGQSSVLLACADPPPPKITDEFKEKKKKKKKKRRETQMKFGTVASNVWSGSTWRASSCASFSALRGSPAASFEEKDPAAPNPPDKSSLTSSSH